MVRSHRISEKYLPVPPSLHVDIPRNHNLRQVGRDMPRGHRTTGSTRGAFRLDEWLVEPDLGLLSRHGEEVRLEIKIMDVLVYLARHASKVVTRQQIIDGVWDGGFISDNTLTHAIAELRRALGDDASNPEYVETIHRRGYRLLKQVTDVERRPTRGLGRPSRFRILIDSRVVQLREGKNLIGRLPEAAVCVSSVQASRHHARIVVGDFTAYLEDLSSKNGTSLNGTPVRGRVPLHDGDWIYLGDGVVAMQFIEVGDSAPTEVPDAVTPTGGFLDA